MPFNFTEGAIVDRVPLSKAVTTSLLSAQRTQGLLDRVTNRLATGREVNTILDNPQNYFASQGLNNRAADLTRRLDGIGQNIKTISTATRGLESIEQLLQLGQNIALEELEKRRSGIPLALEEAPAVPPLNTQITNSNPAAYWRLNDTSGSTATNQGSIGGAVNGTYTGGPSLDAEPLYEGGGRSVDFNGTGQYVAIPSNAQINTSPHNRRSVELVFNADTVTGRQVLYEEGATVNALSIYILNGQLHVAGRDQGEWGPPDISMPIVAGETYHVSFTMDAIAGEFIGYVNGMEIGRTAVTTTFPSHGGDVAIGGMRNGNWFHDGSINGDGFYFDGRISDVALYNSTLSPTEISDRAEAVLGVTEINTENRNFSMVMNQITRMALDSHYKGNNLLDGGLLQTLLNEDGSNKLVTEGGSFTSEGLQIEREGFDTVEGILQILNDVQNAILSVRTYSQSLSLDLSLLQTREDFTRQKVNNLIEGSDKLTLADMNEESARYLALNTRQALATTALSLATESSRSILSILSE